MSPTEYTMFLSLMILCSVIILSHGVNSHFYPKVLTKGTEIFTKRQDNIEQCVIDGLSGNSECDLSIVDSFASVFCLPDCGQFALDVARDCGADPAALAALCDSNENGEFCYDLLDRFVQLINSVEETCFTSEVCPSACQSELSQGVTELGCCVSALVDVVMLSMVDPEDLFGECNIDLPESCNNEPPDDGNNEPPEDRNNEPPEDRNNSPLSSTSFQAYFFSMLSALALMA